jgi:hypothetical protein
MVKFNIGLRAEVCPGGWSLKISIEPSAFSNQPKEGLATLCRPNSWNEEIGLKLSGIGWSKKKAKGFDRSVTVRSNWG